MSTYLVGSSPFGGIAVFVLAILLVAAWVILAASRFVQGGVVERPDRVPQLYGYTACLVGLLMAVTSVLSLTEATMARAAPVYPATGEEWTGGWGEPSVTSFEAFRATYDRARELRLNPGEPRPEPLPDTELRRRYEAFRADRIARVVVTTQRTFVKSGLSLLIGVALFAFHWRWLRRHPGP
jgi:hypothetical protein